MGAGGHAGPAGTRTTTTSAGKRGRALGTGWEMRGVFARSTICDRGIEQAGRQGRAGHAQRVGLAGSSALVLAARGLRIGVARHLDRMLGGEVMMMLDLLMPMGRVQMLVRVVVPG